MKHIVGLCARLRAVTISSVREPRNVEELKHRIADPIDEFYAMRPLTPDKFAHELALCMDRIFNSMKTSLLEIKNSIPDIEKKMNLPMEEKAHNLNGSTKTGNTYSIGLAGLRELINLKATSKHSQQTRLFLLKCIHVLQKCYSCLKMNELFPARMALSYLTQELQQFERTDLRANTMLNETKKEQLTQVSNILRSELVIFILE